ncbi:MAG: hypothetical protein IJZ74_10905 [Clostridia bacterium]|nr:hypothetical protein [Clostridia bacterium]
MQSALTDILCRAGRIMTDYQAPQVFAKGKHADFVTEADIAVQEFLLDALAKAYPGARFFAEESEENVLTDALTFIIDPIDGTTNYFRRRCCSMISVGAVESKKPVFGALYDPYRRELFMRRQGRAHGAAMNVCMCRRSPLNGR